MHGKEIQVERMENKLLKCQQMGSVIADKSDNYIEMCTIWLLE